MMGAEAQPPETDAWGRERQYTSVSPSVQRTINRKLVADMAVLRTQQADVAVKLAAIMGRLEAIEANLATARFDDQFALSVQLARSDWVKRLAVVVAAEWDIASTELLGPRRNAEFIRPRFVLYWLLRQATDYSYPVIARIIRSRDHTTIMHGCRRVEKWREEDEVLRHTTDQLLVIAGRLRGERPSLEQQQAAAAAEQVQP